MSYTLSTLKVIIRDGTPELKQVIKVLSRFPDLKYQVITLSSFGSKHEEDLTRGNTSPTIFPWAPDQAILQGKADLIIQSANDLPYPLPAGLEIIALLEAYGSTGQIPSRGTKEQHLMKQDSKVETVFSNPGTELLAIVSLANRQELKALFANQDIRNQFGKVTLVGFGPGNPDLLTLGGDKALAQSDIIFHDDLLDIDYLKKYRAEKVYVGKRKGSHRIEQNVINRLLLGAAKAGKQVVRLKGGDPMIFAHGGEEVEYLERNLIPVEVIPGVSAGIAVSSLLKVPLTHRGISSSVAFISGHSENVSLPDADTLIVYMGGSNIRTIARKAIEQGRDHDIPVMLVHNLSLPGQKEFFFTLGELALIEQTFPTPVIILIGEVVSFRNRPAAELSKNNLQVLHSTISHFSDLEKDKSFERLIFTNLQIVNSFIDAKEKPGKDSHPLAALKTTAVGKKTKEALKEYGS